MEKKKKILGKHKSILQLLKKHNKLYFSSDNPKISDDEYDQIKNQAFELEKKYPFLKKIDSVENILGSKPSNKFKKIRHLRPMLSLSNAFGKKDMQDFIKKNFKFFKFKKPTN